MRYTEAIHPNTTHLDQMDASHLLASLQHAELEVFHNDWGAGLWDAHFLKDLNRLQKQIRETLAHPKGKVVISGAGTSGRLALQTALTSHYNQDRQRVFGLLAGGPGAFFRAKEGVEDSPQAGIRDLEALPLPEGPSVLIGITCGLSAAYVAGTIHAAMAANYDAIAVLGFNPAEAANRRPLPGLDDDFHGLLTRLANRQGGYLLLPIVGPEPLTGSTRMKGGTASKIVLDLCLGKVGIETGLGHCQRVLEATLAQEFQLVPILEKASHSLLHGGALVYLTCGRPGLMTLLDASECPPTFGAAPDQVIALIDPPLADSFSDLGLANSLWTSATIKNRTGSTIIGFTSTHHDSAEFVEAIRNFSAARTPLSSKAAKALGAAPAEMRSGLLDLILKRNLNALSTGAFVLAGKVWRNIMIDLSISNLKLFHRACRIISQITGRGEDAAWLALAQTILQTEDKPVMMEPEKLLPLAANRKKLVPITALRLGAGQSASEAGMVLKQHPKVKDALKWAMELA